MDDKGDNVRLARVGGGKGGYKDVWPNKGAFSTSQVYQQRFFLFKIGSVIVPNCVLQIPFLQWNLILRIIISLQYSLCIKLCSI